MFRQFLCDGTSGQLLWAWFGLLTFIGHHAFKAYLSWRLNVWYEHFYDLLQTSIQSLEFASGNSGSGDAFYVARQEVWDRLIEFAWIVAPAIVINPLANLIRNWWVFSWRKILMKTYLRQYNTAIPALEGTSQRIHEDTQRFANGVQGCVGIVLHSIFTLAVFCPVMYALDPSLMGIAIAVAMGSLCVSIIIGRPLVGLEVNNQKVEAQLRKDLVLLEVETPTNGTVSRALSNDEGSADASKPSSSVVNLNGPDGAYAAFREVFHSLTQNYKRLYFNFTTLGTWLALYEQVAVLLPYLLAAPRLFASSPETRLSLGQLMKVANSFGRVFDSLNVVSDNWLQINEWRSVVRRLAEYEREMDSRRAPARRPVQALVEISSTSTPASLQIEQVQDKL